MLTTEEAGKDLHSLFEGHRVAGIHSELPV
jgi:hypothetical protein